MSIKVTGEATYADMLPDEDSEHADWTTHAMDTWKGTVQDAAHGVTEVAGGWGTDVGIMLPS